MRGIYTTGLAGLVILALGGCGKEGADHSELQQPEMQQVQENRQIHYPFNFNPEKGEYVYHPEGIDERVLNLLLRSDGTYASQEFFDTECSVDSVEKSYVFKPIDPLLSRLMIIEKYTQNMELLAESEAKIESGKHEHPPGEWGWWRFFEELYNAAHTTEDDYEKLIALSKVMEKYIHPEPADWDHYGVYSLYDMTVLKKKPSLCGDIVAAYLSVFVHYGIKCEDRYVDIYSEGIHLDPHVFFTVSIDSTIFALDFSLYDRRYILPLERF